MDTRLLRIAEQFSAEQAIVSIRALGNGLINDTYKVEGSHSCFVMQRVNRHVFPDPQAIMHNLETLQRHLSTPSIDVALTLPKIIPCRHEDHLFIDAQGDCWRAMEFIAYSECREVIRTRFEAQQLGFALAHFHRLFITLDTESLRMTLPGFHDTGLYLSVYRDINTDRNDGQDPQAERFCRRFIDGFAGKATALQRAKVNGELGDHVIHGDPKLNNFLFAAQTDRVVSLIDLDTVMPGLIQYDIGDCIRSSCYDKAEDRFDVDRCALILQSYFQEMKPHLSKSDVAYFFTAIELVPFELGLRFFCDYLKGNLYFKVDQPEQNLYRAVEQFRLCEKIGQCESVLAKVINDFKLA